MTSFGTIMKNLNWSYLTDILKSVIPALICIVLHELAHGLAAYKMGDDTAKRMGRLTLNPLRHIDPLGLICMAVLHFGWAKPVPINMYNFKNPKRGMALTALAGPAMNLLISAAFLGAFSLSFEKLVYSDFGIQVLRFFYTTAYLSLYLALFNLVPIPPLDGSKVLFSFLPDEHYRRLMRYERYGMIIFAVIIFSGVITRPLSTAVDYVFGKLFDLIV